FGRALWSRNAGPDRTEYVLAAIPLGGYVKMLDEREGDVAPHEVHRAFNRQSLRVRTAVVLAGPIANFLLTIVAYWVMFLVGIVGPRALVGEVNPDSIAARGGLEPATELVSVANRDTKTWESVVHAVLAGVLDDGQVSYTAQSADGRQRSGSLDFGDVVLDDLTQGKFFDAIGIAPARPRYPAVIGHVEPGGAADASGLRVGDEVVGATVADGSQTPIADWSDWVTFVRSHPNQLLDVEVVRGGQRTRLAMRPAGVANGDTTVGFIGAGVADPGDISAGYYATERYGPVESFERALKKSWEVGVLTLGIFWKMVQLEVSVKNLSGPISIAQYAGHSAKVGFPRFLEFLAIVSISLGILNLLPVPILDGGHLVYFFAEWVKGGPVSEQAQVYGQKVGIVLLVGLMSLAFYNDLVRLLG
ncbi:MAG: RIP metalloprotease RseP, partial [Gammaproteobacteria bacterium]|nr:RIP metalloprotease RseP [Gammaproteobacteria bacterium]